MPTPFFFSPMIEKASAVLVMYRCLEKMHSESTNIREKDGFSEENSLFTLSLSFFILNSSVVDFPTNQIPLRHWLSTLNSGFLLFSSSPASRFAYLIQCLYPSENCSRQWPRSGKKSKADEGRTSNAVDQASTKSLETSSQMMTSFSSSKWTVSGQSYSRSVSSRQARVSLRFRTVQPVMTTLSSMSHANWTTTFNIPW